MFTIKSISEEGVYYLSSAWWKNKALWVEEKKLKAAMLFKTAAGAKGSLTRLLKIMPEYKTDKFVLVEILSLEPFAEKELNTNA